MEKKNVSIHNKSYSVYYDTPVINSDPVDRPGGQVVMSVLNQHLTALCPLHG